VSTKIVFQIYESESTFLDPRNKYEPTTIKFQVRIDPLTGRTGHFSHLGAMKAQKLDLESYAQPVLKGFCPFCLENRDKATPKFTPKVYPEGRPSRGEATLIPNLFPYDVHSAIMIMSDEHVVPLSGFHEKRLSDAFSLGIEFLKRTRTVDPMLPYHLMTWNYMPPSGGGLVHPHQQYFATKHPGNQFMDELRASESYLATADANFWQSLIEEETSLGDRFIGRIGTSHWLSSFVSFSFHGDILCVFPDVFSIDDVSGDHIDHLVSGLRNVFRYYESIGIYSFNAALFFGPKNQQSFPCHFRIAPRTFLNTRDFAPDMNFFQTILAEPICVKLPEELCQEVKGFF
jgi:UDPglucose--hexose-1-phosphate uridylyltransferase